MRTTEDIINSLKEKMTAKAVKYFRFINALQQAAMTAPYAAQIPRDALVEMIGVLTDHYNRRFPIASQMRLDKVMGETPLNVSSTNPMVSRDKRAPKLYQCDACDWKGNEQELVQQCVPCCPMCLGDVSEIDGPRHGPEADGSQKPNDAAAIPCAKAGSSTVPAGVRSPDGEQPK